MSPKHNNPRPAAPPPAARMLEDIIGCKWSLAVLGSVRRGVRRPGAMEHAIDGISKKVLNERLSKLVRFGILHKQAFAELPPRVEYRLTPFGERFAAIVDAVERLEGELQQPAQQGGRAMAAAGGDTTPDTTSGDDRCPSSP